MFMVKLLLFLLMTDYSSPLPSPPQKSGDKNWLIILNYETNHRIQSDYVYLHVVSTASTRSMMCPIQSLIDDVSGKRSETSESSLETRLWARSDLLLGSTAEIFGRCNVETHQLCEELIDGSLQLAFGAAGN